MNRYINDIAAGPVLNWLVAKSTKQFDLNSFNIADHEDWLPNYSANWVSGGDIFEALVDSGMRLKRSKSDALRKFQAKLDDHLVYGDTVLETAMRCKVAKDIGMIVELPWPIVEFMQEQQDQ